MQKWLITGANGNLGKRLIVELLTDSTRVVVAVVRSARAERELIELPLDTQARERLNVRVLDYTDEASLHAASLDCNKAVHLVGILKETKYARYTEAHEDSTGALLRALADTSVDHLTYLSIAGSSSTSHNSCLASKGRAEDLCRQSAVAACVLRVPMVLGEGDYASYALKSRASKSTSFTFRASSAEQPIYAGDVVRAIIAAATLGLDVSLDLGGPEILSRRALTQRAANVLGSTSRVISLPVGLGMIMAGLMELLPNPPMTRAMLGVLDHDDSIDPQPALQNLQMAQLTELDDTLSAVLL